MPQYNRSVRRIIRASEWWGYKVAPALGAYYGTLFLARVPVATTWRTALVLIAAIAVEAAYVSLLNDLTDRDIDHAAGKPLRTGSPALPLALLIACIVAGAAIAYAWRGDLPVVVTYAAGWLAFTLYSLPPFRFKTRGIHGVICDAAGAQLLPAVMAVLVAAGATRSSADATWLGAVAAWAFANGVRGIVWHQLRDEEADRRTNVGTFVVRRGAGTATFIATWIAFPVELLALAAMLATLHSVWPIAALALYAALMLLRPRRYGAHASIVTPAPRSFLILNEYGEAYLPVAILIASALVNRIDAVVLAVHLFLFPRQSLQLIREVAGLARIRSRHAASQRDSASSA